MRRAALLIGTVAFLAGLAGMLAWYRDYRLDPERLYAVSAKDLGGDPALLRARQRYENRGSRYIWGSNDCSAFVSDYLTAAGVPIGRRMTTKCLAEPDLTRRGLVDAGPADGGDVLNFRYLSKDGLGMAGHCGVVLRRGEELWVVHNREGSGLVMQRIEGFYRLAEGLGVSRRAVRTLRPIRAEVGSTSGSEGPGTSKLPHRERRGDAAPSSTKAAPARPSAHRMRREAPRPRRQTSLCSVSSRGVC